MTAFFVALGNEDCDDKPHEDFYFTIGKSIYAVTIGNLDLGYITNGCIGGPIGKRSFDYCFQKYKLINQWIKVGFLVPCNDL